MSAATGDRRFYVGFDIGDAESIVEFSVTGTESVQPATMPGKNAAGQAIPTLFGYDKDGRVVLADTVANDYENLSNVEMNFKRRPSDLISVSEERTRELLILDVESLLDAPELAGGEVMEYAKKLIEFVNIVLSEPTFVERARAFASGCDDCAICVGHPTNWNALDKAIYKSILMRSVLGNDEYLGLPLSFTLESESRAAFLYIKNTYQIKLSDNDFVGLMDIGSSTIDISVLTKDSRTCVYDSGSNFLGARSIDYLILEHYIQNACTDDDDKQMINDILRNNDAAWEHLLLNCRLAKESVFSAADADKSRISARILFADFRPFRLTYNVLVNDICNRPIAPVLKKYIHLPESDCLGLGDVGWQDAFRGFVLQEVAKMDSVGITLNKLFLTGSASRMSFVREICASVLPQVRQGDSLFDDVNPSNAIAHGLARVGASEHKADSFQTDIDKFFDKNDGELYNIIKRRIPDLTQSIANPILDTIKNMVIIPKMNAWKRGEIKTLAQMMKDVEQTCSNQETLSKLLDEDDSYSKAVESWTVDQVGNDIALALQRIATKHNVYDFTLEQLNVFKSLAIGKVINIGGKRDVLSLTPANKIANVISGVVGIVSYFLIPFILGFVVGLIGLIFPSIAIAILSALIAIPGGIIVAGFALIAVLLAGGVKKGYENNKEEINEWLLTKNLPKVARSKVKIEDFETEFSNNRYENLSEIAAKLNTPDVINGISAQIYAEVYPQVEARSNQIKYVIENR